MRLLVHLCNQRALTYHIEHMWPHCSPDKLKNLLHKKNFGIKNEYIVEDFGWPRKKDLFENKIIAKN